MRSNVPGIHPIDFVATGTAIITGHIRDGGEQRQAIVKVGRICTNERLQKAVPLECCAKRGQFGLSGVSESRTSPQSIPIIFIAALTGIGFVESPKHLAAQRK